MRMEHRSINPRGHNKGWFIHKRTSNRYNRPSKHKSNCPSSNIMPHILLRNTSFSTRCSRRLRNPKHSPIQRVIQEDMHIMNYRLLSPKCSPPQHLLDHQDLVILYTLAKVLSIMHPELP